MLELIKMKMGHVPQVNALGTLFDRRITYSQFMLEEIKAFFGEQMLPDVIRLNVTLKRAASEGISVIDLDRTSNGAKDYTVVSYEILRLDGVEHPERPIVPSVSAQPPEDVMEQFARPDVETVTFTMEAPTANDVYILGDFNDWKIDDLNRLARYGDGRWEKRMELPHGRYRYKFVVDGEWTLDSNNEESERNEFGTFDSVLKI
jgi:5'-AMP-activated protein kinase regulatory beta subunit